jgi:DNA-binding transcriptional ArsR family regulator
MTAEKPKGRGVAGVAAAIGEPARARMLYCLMDGRARTSTELALVADVSPSTASVHLSRLVAEHLVKVVAQGKHRYYSLDGSDVANVLEGLSVLAGDPHDTFVPGAPQSLRTARTCYDHLAGSLGVSLHDRFVVLGWLSAGSVGAGDSYEVTTKGAKAFDGLGIDLSQTRNLRRRFAYACLDWSERRSHIGGALGAAVLKLALKRKWVFQDRGTRALGVTGVGRREMFKHFGLALSHPLSAP